MIFLERMTSREKIMVGTTLLLLAGLVLFFAVISPYQTAMNRLDQSLDSTRQQLQQARQLQPEIATLQSEIELLESGLDSTGGFTPLAYLEGVTTRLVSREQITYMRPKPVSRQGDLQIEPVEMKIERLDLGQAVQLTDSMTKAKSPLRIDQLDLKRRHDDRRRLDLILTVVATRRGE
ncbi:MAG: hypothetical protein C0614_00780 [Desulfuromonas sp.]|nr:MAG: hypothetical protein C0614_00780 [Desulfuromonas sp.]